MTAPAKIVIPQPQTMLQKVENAVALSWNWVQSHSLEILVACVSGAILVALLYGLKRLGAKLVVHPDQWRSVIGRALVSMRPWFMVMVAIQIVTSTAGAPEPIGRAVQILFTIAATIQAAIFLRELILGTIEFRAGGADATGSLGNALGLIRLLVSVVLFLLATVLILSNIGVNVTGLVAGLGIGGIAIGLAAQGIFSDLFAALAIIFDKPFKRGDVITFDTFTGTVEYVGLKSTRIRMLSGELIIVSNTNLLSKVVSNSSHVTKRRVVQPLGILYETPLGLCDALPRLLHEAFDELPGCHFFRCTLDAFGQSSLDYKLIYEIDGDTPDEWNQNKHAANLKILTLFAEHDIAFAYPTQTSYTAGPDGKLVLPYAEEAKLVASRALTARLASG